MPMPQYEFTQVSKIVGRSSRERKLNWRAAHPDSENEYETVRRAHEYFSREFIAWDGEGSGGVTTTETNADDATVTVKTQNYVLLGNSKGLSMSAENGLGMTDMFEAFLDASVQYPNAIHVVYGASYDFNMMLRELSKGELQRLYSARGSIFLRGYRLRWMRGRRLRIEDADKRRKVTIFDVQPFFQMTFVRACDEYLGKDWLDRDRIIAEKANRSEFEWNRIAEIVEYNKAELVNLVRLMNELRQRLDRIDIRLDRWDGPGAIAGSLLGKKGHKVQEHMDGALPEEVARASRYAYAGGRFEVFKFGISNDPVWEYDINSAYPAAMQHLPSLKGGSWELHDGDPGSKPFAIYHVKWKLPITHPDAHDGYWTYPGPLFFRTPNGAINYPPDGSGWYWSPEYDALADYKTAMPLAEFAVLEAWVFTPATDYKPFGFVGALYEKRQALKEREDGAQLAAKLALNSMYGKTAQQVGWWVDKSGKDHLPTFHQLEWAGFTTSYARATLLRAMVRNPGAIIAAETDALFSTEPIELDCSPGLGNWKPTEFENLTYVMSGVYFGSVKGKEVTAKTRGIPRKYVDRETVEATMFLFPEYKREMVTEVTNFYAAGLALSQDFDKWCAWVTRSRIVSLGMNSDGAKRTHVSCCDCNDPKFQTAKSMTGWWHVTACQNVWITRRSHHSAEYPVAWANPNPEMTALEDLRETHYEEGWDDA